MKRTLSTSLLSLFLKEPLWMYELKDDCNKREAFLAVRNNLIDIYYKGGRLFCYDKHGFKTHMKYAAVIDKPSSCYLTSIQLASSKLISNFRLDYPRIKENCAKYSGVESRGVAEIYRKHSYLSDSDIVVLDIEVAFPSLGSTGTQDRIDILLFNKLTKTLRFVEAKDYSNKELWSTKKPDVIDQIARYESQVMSNSHLIIKESTEHIKILNILFGKKLPYPVKVDNKVTLLIFGFDNDQKNGRLKKHIIGNPYFKGLKVYPIGKVKGLVPENIWNARTI
jgi:hypothetical protein